MRRGTTPALVLTVDADIVGWTVYVTIEKGGREITLENDRLTMSYANSKTTIELALTQEETLSLSPGTCEIQVRAINDGTAIATDIETIDVGRILLEGVINE